MFLLKLRRGSVSNPTNMANPAVSASVPPFRSEFRVLICIMPDGRGKEVLEALRRETGVISAFAHHARGIGTHSLRYRVYAQEKQILTVLVEASRADDVFHFLYFGAGLDTPRAGMIMMGHAFRGAGVVPLNETESEAS